MPGRGAGGAGRGSAQQASSAGRGSGDAGSVEGARRVGFRGTDVNKYTRICQRWEAGHCRFGDRCNFAHGEEQLRQLPPRNAGGGGGRGRGRGGGEGPAYREESGGGRGGGRGQGGVYGRGASASAAVVVANGRAARGGEREQQDDPAWRAAGCPVAGPQGWTQYRTEEGEAYYHNSKTQETVWDAPECWKNAPKVN